MSNVTIIGGHGKVALLLAPLLTERGDTVTSVFRNPDHTSDVAATGADAVVADVERLSRDELAELLQGADAVVWSAGAGGGNAARTFAVDRDAAVRTIDAAKQAGVRRFVMVSYVGAGQDHGVPQDNPFYAYAQAKADADDHLRASGLDWTIVAPGALTLEEPTGRIDLVTKGDGGAHETSRANVARVVAAALTEPATVGRMIEFSDGDTPIEEALTAHG
ncbi:SDR family oxidoreductase [Georgenia sp. 311]|uniref:SDR family oxidoreductase n=1 Tax=Georgenia wutianyii TaxID=2585135 RepID=A0ABX5VMC2_9MICO|nr:MULTISPECIES: SDR family oxidoreductase [Georgenia]QDB79622.1 SDR family oxidoreductase [Georgenia wutianyii]TNC16581.1 SDR family oxidoreductase [Georgenia sp. 311]